MRDKTEGMELFYVTPALTGAGLGHSRKATQVDPTRAISRHCPLLTVVLPLGLLGVGPAQLCTYSPGVPHRGPLHSGLPLLPQAYSGKGTLAASLHTAGNSIPTRVGQLAHPGKPPPLNLSRLQVVKQRPSLLPGCGASSEWGGTALAQAQANHTLSYLKNCPRKPFLD